MTEKQITAEFEREQANKYRLDATEILWMAQQEGLLREDYVSAVDAVKSILAELKRTRTELKRANIENRYRLRQVAHENAKMNARLVEIYKRAACYKKMFRQANTAKRAARKEGLREMEW